jgi:hypothetical protein
MPRTLPASEFHSTWSPRLNVFSTSIASCTTIIGNWSTGMFSSRKSFELLRLQGDRRDRPAQDAARALKRPALLAHVESTDQKHAII